MRIDSAGVRHRRPKPRGQTAALDGRRFEGVFIQRGKTAGDADPLTFSGGRKNWVVAGAPK